MAIWSIINFMRKVVSLPGALLVHDFKAKPFCRCGVRPMHMFHAKRVASLEAQHPLKVTIPTRQVHGIGFPILNYIQMKQTHSPS